MQNGFCESFNGRMRDELLDESLFLGLDHARSRIANWITITTSGTALGSGLSHANGLCRQSLRNTR